MAVSVHIGLPYLPSEADHPFLAAVAELGADTLISVGSLFRADRGWRPAPLSAWSLRPMLDSQGFWATLAFGGYRWSVADYVERVVLNFPREDGDEDDEPIRAALPFPWATWSAPDYCCEPAVASDRGEVTRRVEQTTESFAETLETLEAWRREGETGVPDPLPVLQGWRPDDYLTSAEQLAAVFDGVHGCTCPSSTEDGDDCGGTWHRAHAGLPERVGVGSVCGRPLHGPDGLLAVLDALHGALPEHVTLHLFGVKSAALLHLPRYGDRVVSVDSCAWDRAARWDAVHAGVSNTIARRAAVLQRWARRQMALQEAGELLALLEARLAAAPPQGLTDEDVRRFFQRRQGALRRITSSALLEAA